MDLFSTLLTSIAITGIITFVWYHLRLWRMYQLAEKFSGPRPTLPIIGNAYFFLGNTKDLLNKVITIPDKYGTPARCWIGPKLFVLLCKPDHIKTVLQSPKTIDKSEILRFFHPWVGTGLVTAPAAKWRVHRKLITPSFNQRILESFVDIIVQQANKMVSNMQVEVGRGDFDVFNYISLCTLDIICETAMGISVKAQEDNSSYIVYAINRLFEIPCIRIFQAWLHPDIIFYNTKLGKNQTECVEYLHKYANMIIEEKQKQTSSSIDAPKSNQSKWKPFLDLLMEVTKSGKKLTNEELRDEINTMVAAANDSTATVNTFIIYMLANFPEVQQKCYEEICRIAGDEINSETPIKYEQLPQLEYLERVIKETMRLFPPLPILLRHANEDLDIGDLIVPKGSTIAVSIINTHRDKEFWTDPFKFDPDRFLPENNSQRHPYAYIPFSAGPRNCIGLNYAMMSMKLLLSMLISKFIFTKDITHVKIEDIKLSIKALTRTIEPIAVKIERRAKKLK